MPRIPVAQNQYEMRALPQVQRARLVDNRGDVLADAADKIGDVQYKIEVEDRNKADRAAFMEADRATDEISNSLYQQASSRKLKDAMNSSPETLSEFDKQSGEVMKALKTPRQKQAYQAALNQSRSNLQRNVETHERQQTEQYYEMERKSFAAQTHKNAVTFYKDAPRIEQELAKQRSVVNQTPGLSAEMKGAAAAQMASETYADVIDRYLVNDELNGAEAYYKSIKANVVGEAATRIENSIRVTRDRLEARARSHADKREAKAERAINEYDRQISSTAPATKEDMLKWETLTKGTTFEAEFKDRLKSEREVQDVLRLPPQEQLAYAAKAQAKLLSGGGSVRDQADAARLSAAVSRNVDNLVNNPIVFDAQRNSAEPQELDAVGLIRGDAAAADVLQDRMTTVDSLRKKYGAAVKYRPLLDSDAKQLSQTIQQLPWDQQAGALANLRHVTQNKDAYNGILSQIAPDKPVIAIAGKVAAKDAQMKDSPWYKTDSTVPSEKVAERLLRGNAILAPSKTEQGTDGKPKAALYLPDDKPLQEAFIKATGNAFAGNEAAAQNAYQAVRAYYAGKNDETGTLAGSKDDVDDDLIDEAVRNTLGTTVNFHSKGSVFAPWGMSEDTFLDRAKLAFTQKAKAIGLDDVTISNYSNMGLMETSDGRYGLTNGNHPLLDKTGNPIVIDVTSPIAVEKTEVIRGKGVVGTRTEYQ